MGIESLMVEMPGSLRQALVEGYCMLESAHTERAVEVRKLYRESMEKISNWLNRDISDYVNYNKKCTHILKYLDAIYICFPVRGKWTVEFRLRYPSNEDTLGGSFFDSTDKSIVIDINDIAEVSRYDDRKVFTLHKRIKEGRLDIDSELLEGLLAITGYEPFQETLMHELTHLVQELHGEDFTKAGHLFQNGISLDSYDPVTHHELLPWEIDADVQGKIGKLAKYHLSYTATEMAKRLYDLFIHDSMEQYGFNDPNRKKQCWNTAVSLARAIKLAAERDDVNEEDLDSLISHIDDYAV